MPLGIVSDRGYAVKFLGITFYNFSYKAQETWEDNKIQSLQVNLNDDGEEKEITGAISDGGFSVRIDRDNHLYPHPMITTNHWKADVVNSHLVLNTLTGLPNLVQINDMGWEDVEISQGSVLAKKYEYTGDLKDTSVWYDQDGRWVKLAFKARDGSQIEYFCQTCPVGKQLNAEAGS